MSNKYKYARYLKLLRDNKQTLIDKGIRRADTLEDHLSGRVQACPGTIMATAMALGRDWKDYVD